MRNAFFRHSKARFSVPLLFGFTMFCCFAVKVEMYCKQIFATKKRQSSAVLQWVAIRVLRLQHATCPLSTLKGTVFRAFAIGYYKVLSFCSKVEMYCKQIFATKKRQSSAVLQWVAIRVLRLQHATCRFRGLLPHRT